MIEREMLTALLNNEKIAEELLAETRTQHDTFEYGFRRIKAIKRKKKTKKKNNFGLTTTTLIK